MRLSAHTILYFVVKRTIELIYSVNALSQLLQLGRQICWQHLETYSMIQTVFAGSGSINTILQSFILHFL